MGIVREPCHQAASAGLAIEHGKDTVYRHDLGGDAEKDDAAHES